MRVGCVGVADGLLIRIRDEPSRYLGGRLSVWLRWGLRLRVVLRCRLRLNKSFAALLAK